MTAQVLELLVGTQQKCYGPALIIEGCAVPASRFNMTSLERHRAQEQIMAWPLPHVLYRLETEQRIPTEQIPEAVEEWRKFMVTILYADGQPVGMVSPIVDEVWHAHILFTKEYAQFCREIFGQQIGHAPNWPGSPLDGQSGNTFLSVYQGLYGKLPAIWTSHMGAAAKCSIHCDDIDTYCTGDQNCRSVVPAVKELACGDCFGPPDCDTCVTCSGN